jgi:hypothetical protein
MFDDPNLHWSSYGYIDYEVLTRHAAAHNYHVALAMIPIDTWFTHRATVSLFLENRRALSLLVHGNNHTFRELACNYSMAQSQGLAAQALMRIRHFERRLGMRVARVMAAPHGACTEPMANSLLRSGFEAACISHGSLLRHNPGKALQNRFGWGPSEFLGDGLPIIPRFRMSSDCAQNAVFGALTGQPIVPVGHHQDLRGGLGLLEDIAQQINRLGAVEWCSLERMARTNFLSRESGKGMALTMYSRQIEVQVPAGVEELIIQRPWPQRDLGAETIELHSLGQPVRVLQTSEPTVFRIRSDGPTNVVVKVLPSTTLVPSDIKVPRVGPWACLRRILAEGRDRLQPILRP